MMNLNLSETRIAEIENICTEISRTTIIDETFGAMNSKEEIEEMLGFELVEGFTMLNDENYLQVEFEERTNSTWIIIEVDSAEDYEYIVSGAWNEPLEDEEEYEEDEEDEEDEEE